MNDTEIVKSRLINQQIAATKFTNPQVKKNKSVVIETNLFTILNEREKRGLEKAIKRYKELME